MFKNFVEKIVPLVAQCGKMWQRERQTDRQTTVKYGTRGFYFR